MKPNHICKLSTCRAHYYACDYCDATESYKSMCCSFDHYQKYMEEILAARKKGVMPDLLPDRTDMTKQEIKKMKKRPLKEIKEKTLEELKEYAKPDGEIDIIETVEMINEELKQQNK